MQDFNESVSDDTAFMANHPLINPSSKITGWIYNMSGGPNSHSISQVFPTSP
jgi:hypothetical protein